MNHERDELREQHRVKLPPAGREVLNEPERSTEVSELPSDNVLACADALSPSNQEEIAAVAGGMAEELAERQRENRQRAVLDASAAEAIREAQERERAAGRPVDPKMTLGDTLEILGR